MNTQRRVARLDGMVMTPPQPRRPPAMQSLLQQGEANTVNEWIMRLGMSPARRPAGHLVAELNFGFWVRLCNAPYDHGNSLGPGLWPYAASRFRLCPTTHQTAATTISTLLQQELLGELLANPLRPKIG